MNDNKIPATYDDLEKSDAYVSVVVAAKRLGVDDSVIRRYAGNGEIPGAVKVRWGLRRRVWAIPVVWVEKYLKGL